MIDIINQINEYCCNVTVIITTALITLFITTAYWLLFKFKEKDNTKCENFIFVIKDAATQMLLAVFIVFVLECIAGFTLKEDLCKIFDYKYLVLYIIFFYNIFSSRDLFRLIRQSEGLRNTKCKVDLDSYKRHYEKSVEVVMEEISILKSLAPTSLMVLLATWLLQDKTESLIESGWGLFLFAILIIYCFALVVLCRKLQKFKHWEVDVQKRIDELEQLHDSTDAQEGTVNAS